VHPFNPASTDNQACQDILLIGNQVVPRIDERRRLPMRRGCLAALRLLLILSASIVLLAEGDSYWPTLRGAVRQA